MKSPQKALPGESKLWRAAGELGYWGWGTGDGVPGMGSQPGAPHGTGRFWALNPFLRVRGCGRGQRSLRDWGGRSPQGTFHHRSARSGVRPRGPAGGGGHGMGPRWGCGGHLGGVPGVLGGGGTLGGVSGVLCGGAGISGKGPMWGCGGLCEGCGGAGRGCGGAPGVRGVHGAEPRSAPPSPSGGNGFSRPRSPFPPPRRVARCRRSGSGRGDVRGGAAPPLRAVGAAGARPPVAAVRRGAEGRPRLRARSAAGPGAGAGRALRRAEHASAAGAGCSGRGASSSANRSRGRRRRRRRAGAAEPCCWPRPWWCGNG